MVKYQHRDNSICIIKSDAGKEWRMMKKVDKKKIILSVLLSSMLWSNSLYAYELSENVLSGDIGQNELENDKSFEKVIVAGNETEIYKLLDNEKLTLNGVTTGVQFTNVEKIENSNLGTVMGGCVENASNNNLVVTGSTAYTINGGFGFSSADNNIVIINNSSIDYLVNGGLATSDGGILGGDTKGKITANGNKVYVYDGSIKYVYGGSTVLLSIDSTSDLEANNNLTEINNYGSSSKKAEAGIILGGAVVATDVEVDGDVTWDSSNNTVNINDSFFVLQKNNGTGILGGTIEANEDNSFNGTATANNNKINIKNSSINVTDASMGITGGYVSEVSSGELLGLTSADNNIVNIDNSTITGLISGGRNDKGQVIDNHIIINNKSVIEGDVIGGYTEGYAAVGNTIEISGNNTLDKANLYGYKGINSTHTITSDNSLKVEDFNGKIKSVNNFEKLEYSNIEWKNDGTVIEAEKTENLINAEVIVSDKNGFKLNSGNLNIGETMTLLHSGNSLGNIKDLENGKDFNTIVGVATAVDGIIEQPDANNITATIKDVKLADQTKLVASNRAVAAAFVNQGTDLIADSLDTLSRDGKYGVKTFAAVHGNRSKYDVNSDIKINGWSTIVGVGAENEHNGGDFSWGVFYENGSGNYRTYNDFNNEFFRGDGSLVYNGGGIAARYENSHGVYTEGSLRAGMLKSEMTDALSDGENKYGYESETAYYGAHIGVGKIFSLGDDSDLDVYGKFFHTYTEGDSFNVAGDEFEFDSINSDRLRIGARVTSNKENKFSTYYGLAYEYEFNGDAEMRAAGMNAPTQSLQGSSVMAEIGLNYQPTPDSPWSVDLNMRGYAGERQGGSFNVQATYTF